MEIFSTEISNGNMRFEVLDGGEVHFLPSGEGPYFTTIEELSELVARLKEAVEFMNEEDPAAGAI